MTEEDLEERWIKLSQSTLYQLGRRVRQYASIMLRCWLRPVRKARRQSR